MRLSNKDIAAIKEVTRRVFGDNATISLFGSRTDDNKKGGDIDLFIQCNCQISREELYQLKIKFLVLLKKIIDDQKIDVLINGGQLSKSLLEAVQKEEVQLWQTKNNILNTLERLQIIDSSDTWLTLRELRNDLAHDYPIMIDETIDKLNYLFLQLPLIENIFETIEQQAER